MKSISDEIIKEWNNNRYTGSENQVDHDGGVEDCSSCSKIREIKARAKQHYETCKLIDDNLMKIKSESVDNVLVFLLSERKKLEEAGILT